MSLTGRPSLGAAVGQGTVPRKDDEKADYSSRSPTPDLFVKLDVYVPGTDIVSLLVPDSPLEKQTSDMRVGEGYMPLCYIHGDSSLCRGSSFNLGSQPTP